MRFGRSTSRAVRARCDPCRVSRGTDCGSIIFARRSRTGPGRDSRGWPTRGSAARGGRGGGGEVRVEDANLLPVLLVFLDEFQVPRVVLVLVVRGLVRKDDVQRHVEVAVVDGAVQVGECTRGEIDRSLVPGEIQLG